MVFCLVFWKSYPPQFRKSTPQKLWWKDIVEFSHFQNFKNFSRIRQNFFFPLFYFASFFFAKVYFDFFFWQLSFHKHARSNWAFQFENKSDTIIVMNFIQKYHFLNNSFDKKKNKIEGHGLLSCDDLHEPQNTHKHNKKTFINWRKKKLGVVILQLVVRYSNLQFCLRKMITHFGICLGNFFLVGCNFKSRDYFQHFCQLKVVISQKKREMFSNHNNNKRNCSLSRKKKLLVKLLLSIAFASHDSLTTATPPF